MSVKNKKYTVNNYTIIELLVVIVVMAILFGVATSGLQSVLGRQGATGAVRTISAKMSLARSFAVARNRYVAMLMPDDNPSTPGVNYTANFTGTREKYLYTYSRLCYVVEDTGNSGQYLFESWVEGYEWQKLPSKTAAYIYENPKKVNNVDDSSTLSSPAIVFKPSGALAGGSQAIIKVFRAYYNPDVNNLIWQGKENIDKGWAITINGFTGRASYAKK